MDFIPIPICGEVDVSIVAPIANHPLFLRLRDITQLATIISEFPGATHTRLEHSLGVYHRTKILTQRLAAEGSIAKQEAQNLNIFALIHDIGHGPLSHIIEPFCRINHNVNGLEILKKLQPPIEQCGGDFKMIQQLFQRTNPLCQIVTNKNMGTDKLDYLDRDAYHTAFGGRPEIDRLFSRVSYNDGELIIPQDEIEEAKTLQQFYMFMYSRVYLRPACLAAARLLQKIISRLLSYEIEESVLWKMTEPELQSRFADSRDRVIRYWYQAYREHRLPQTVISLRYRGYENDEVLVPERHPRTEVFAFDDNYFNKLLTLPMSQLEAMETKIAQITKMDAKNIFFIPTISQRFIPSDIRYTDNDGQIRSLKQRHKTHFMAMEENARTYLSLRIACLEDREKLYKKAEEVLKYINEIIEYQPKRTRGQNTRLF